jgi:hypothetical protein
VVVRSMGLVLELELMPLLFEEEDVDGCFLRITSRFQFARPAVEFNLLDQIILTPPVEADRARTWPFAITSSISLRKDCARSCFWASKYFFAARAAFLPSFCFLSLISLTGLLDGLLGGFRGDVVGEFESEGLEELLSESRRRWRLLRRPPGVFLGEYWSFQSLITSWDQNVSMLGRWGDWGI